MKVTLNNKTIGKIENRIFQKTGNIFWMNKSIGSNIDALNQAVSLGAEIIQVKCKNNKNQVYETEIENFKKFGEEVQIGGYEKQLHVPLKFWRKIK